MRQEFERNHRNGRLNKLWSTLRGRPFHLVDIHEVQSRTQQSTKSYIGLQSVSIERIRGSEGRSKDFDTRWRPLNIANKQRWMSIACARIQGTHMPAVDLIKAGEIYFVRDGHHRISVAKAQGQLEIEANVTAWHSAQIAKSPETVTYNPLNSVMTLPALAWINQLADGIMHRLSALVRDIQPQTVGPTR